MRLHFTTILFIIFESTQKIFTQVVPVSPCPKMFQYGFDGTEWFGILSVRNPDFGQTLHLRVTLTIRGKPSTNYLGEIELLTRGQVLSDAPVLYRIKFPKNPFLPKLLQVTRNNQVICLGGADPSAVTLITLEHWKFTFSPDNMTPPPPPSSSSSGLAGGHFATTSALPITTGLKESPLLPANIVFTKHLPVSNAEKNPMRLSKNICGTIDDRKSFQVLQALQQTTAKATVTTSSVSLSATPKQRNEMAQQNNATGKVGKLSANNTSSPLEEERVESDTDLPPLVTSDTDAMPVDDSMEINELPTITRGSWPWLAAIYVSKLTTLTYQCGGTLISSRVVISAAHCFQLLKKLYTASEILVFLGRHNLNNWEEDGSLVAPVNEIYIHPDFNKHLNSYDADIAVVILKNEVRFNTFIRPACMWSGPIHTEYIEGEHGIVVGWALGGFSTASAVPKIVSTPIVSNKVCFQANPQYRSLSSNRTFCAGVMLQNQGSMVLNKSGFGGKPLSFQHSLHQGPCTGDSGAGLMLFKNNRWILRGTVSGSLPVTQISDDSPVPARPVSPNDGCSNNQYVIYTDVTKFLDWIFSFPIYFNTFIRPACMWSGPIDTEYIEGEHGIVVGWALGGFSTASAVPKIVSTPIVSNKVCFQANPQYRSLSSNRTFCAGVMLQNQGSMALNKSGFDGKPLSFQHSLHQGICTVDSGAGLMLFKNNRWILRGTVSGSLPVTQISDDSSVRPAPARPVRPNDGCRNNQYVIYTDVTKFLDWIFSFHIVEV